MNLRAGVDVVAKEKALGHAMTWWQVIQHSPVSTTDRATLKPSVTSVTAPKMQNSRIT